MSDWPYKPLLPPPVLSPSCLFGPAGGAQTNAQSSAVWPSANQALYVPFWTPVPLVIARILVLNGAAVSGNLDVGIYDQDGTRLVSSGSTAQAGVSDVQEIDITDTLVGPGRFYAALALDNTTGTNLFFGSNSANQVRLLGVLLQASAFPLPAVATFATSNARAPSISLSIRTVN